MFKRSWNKKFGKSEIYRFLKNNPVEKWSKVINGQSIEQLCIFARGTGKARDKPTSPVFRSFSMAKSEFFWT